MVIGLQHDHLLSAKDFMVVFPDPNEDRSPLALDEATRSLYRRVIDNPSSLTDEERRIVTRRPPGPEEDERCQRACGLTFSELVRKAIDQRDSLSYHEAVLLVGGLIPGDAGRWLRYLLRLDEADQDLTHAAIDVAWTAEMREARANAHAVQKRAVQASSAREGGKKREKRPSPLKIDIKHIAPMLFARLTQRDFATEEARQKPYRHGSTLKNLHHVTSRFPTAQKRDGIWPPPARFV